MNVQNERIQSVIISLAYWSDAWIRSSSSSRFRPNNLPTPKRAFFWFPLARVCNVSINAASPRLALWLNNDLDSNIPPPHAVHLCNRRPKHIGQGSLWAIFPSQSIVPLPAQSLQRCTPYPWHTLHSRTARILPRIAAIIAAPTVTPTTKTEERACMIGLPPLPPLPAGAPGARANLMDWEPNAAPEWYMALVREAVGAPVLHSSVSSSLLSGSSSTTCGVLSNTVDLVLILGSFIYLFCIWVRLWLSQMGARDQTGNARRAHMPVSMAASWSVPVQNNNPLLSTSGALVFII